MLEFSAIVSRLTTAVLTAREEHRRAYRTLPTQTAYWGMIDLLGSTLYRVELGPEAGYVHGETFLTLVKHAVQPYQTVTTIKEIGDAVLLMAGDFRDLLESLLLVDASARSITARSIERRHAFGIRAAVTFGQAKELARPAGKDYLGSTIDKLARLASVRDERSNILIDQATGEQEAEVTIRDYPGVDLGTLSTLSPEQAKGFREAVRYFPLIVRDEVLADFRDFFAPWQST